MSDLATLIEQARHVIMTPEQRTRQRISFVYGNLAIEHPDITRALVARIVEEQE